MNCKHFDFSVGACAHEQGPVHCGESRVHFEHRIERFEWSKETNFDARDDDKGVPICTEDNCRQFDGKRCQLLGFRPDRICEPAVIYLRRKREQEIARHRERERAYRSQIDRLQRGNTIESDFITKRETELMQQSDELAETRSQLREISDAVGKINEAIAELPESDRKGGAWDVIRKLAKDREELQRRITVIEHCCTNATRPG